MACALTVTDFFRKLVARRRRAQTLEQLQGLLLMQRWMQSDHAYQRRFIFYTALRTAVETAPWNRRPAEFPANEEVDYFLQPLHEMVNVVTAPMGGGGLDGGSRSFSSFGGSGRNLDTTSEAMGVISHAAAVAAHGYKVLRPRHGLEELRRASGANAGDRGAAGATGAVVLRFVDAVNAWRGTWVVDLRGWGWTGWQVWYGL